MTPTKINLNPKWLDKFPQTPLSEKLHGKTYYHEVICSSSRKTPIGTRGCVCMRRLKDSVDKL